MSEPVNVRLECLKLALARGANDARPWREIADDFFGWVDQPSDNADKPPSSQEGVAPPQAGASGRSPRASSRKAAGPAEPGNPSDQP